MLEVDEAYEYDKEREAEHCFRTIDDDHPGVARLYQQKPLYLAGRVTVFERAEPSFPEIAMDPAETRATFSERGWRRVVGFQTRNPIHRAHEYLTKVALETVDGLLIHPLVGDTKSDDVPAATRVDCYRILVDNYYPAERVLVAAFPAAMRYAGPREAIWHAICRKNYGCSHFIVGRDHAGVGDYYGTSWESSRCSSSTPSTAASAARWRRRRRARTEATTTSSSPGRRCASCWPTASCRRSSSPGPRSQRC
jgi:sulfate adenylyltransferase